MTEPDSPPSSAETSPYHMEVNHVHCLVQELGEAVRWFESVCGVKATFTNERMAVFSLGDFTLILDVGQSDSKVTIGFHSENCDRDYQTVIERGGISLEPPADRPWGARAAYIKGPGALTIEIEQLR